MSQYSVVQQVGIDLTLQQDLVIEHGRSANVLLNELVYLPKNIYAQLIHRSSFNRKGILITGSIFDCGYVGRVGCTIYNLSGQEIKLKANERIAQMIFFKASAASIYNGQYQGEYLNNVL